MGSGLTLTAVDVLSR